MYYVLQDTLRDDSALIGRYPRLPLELSWFGGRRINDALPNPLEFELLVDSGQWMPAFFASGIPLMRVDLITALEEAGVSNLDCYDARIVDPRDGRVFTDYRAVNVIGVIASADMEQSQYDRSNPSRLIDVDFNSLALNESKAGGQLLFRLAECVTAIVVHQRVRDHVEPLALPGISFIRPEQFIG